MDLMSLYLRPISKFCDSLPSVCLHHYYGFHGARLTQRYIDLNGEKKVLMSLALSVCPFQGSNRIFCFPPLNRFSNFERKLYKKALWH